MQRPHGHVDDPLPPETFHHGRLPHVLVRPVAQPVVVALTPRPHQAGLRQRQAELSPALDLHNAHTVQLLHIGGHGAALAAAAAELAEVAVAPAKDHPLVGESEGLGVPAPAGHLHHPVPRQRPHRLGS